MPPMRHLTTAPRSVKLLKFLKDCSDGMRLEELADALGEEGRKAQAATVTMLLDLRQKARVDYAPRLAGSNLRGGVYKATEAGIAYLTVKLKAHPEWADEVEGGEIIETGSMRGESRTVSLVPAAGLLIRSSCDVPNWVFGLSSHGQFMREASAT